MRGDTLRPHRASPALAPPWNGTSRQPPVPLSMCLSVPLRVSHVWPASGCDSPSVIVQVRTNTHQSCSPGSADGAAQAALGPPATPLAPLRGTPVLHPAPLPPPSSFLLPPGDLPGCWTSPCPVPAQDTAVPADELVQARWGGEGGVKSPGLRVGGPVSKPSSCHKGRRVLTPSSAGCPQPAPGGGPAGTG